MSLIQQNAPVSGKKAIDTGAPGAANVWPEGTTTYSACERRRARSPSGSWDRRRFFRKLMDTYTGYEVKGG